MSEAENPGSRARYFGNISFTELHELERNTARARPDQLAKAALYLEEAFSDMKTAWFGGWALQLRGSRRETHDLDFLVLVPSLREVRAVLVQYSWAILSFYELPGGIQERMFIDIDQEGQVVGVDIVLSGELETPDLGEPGSYESIHPFRTLKAMRANVIHITWQVQTKLSVWFGRRKDSDYQDLVFLVSQYGHEIAKWSKHLKKEHRETFYAIFDAATEDQEMCKAVKEILSL